jgi:hypothetical protein
MRCCVCNEWLFQDVQYIVDPVRCPRCNKNCVEIHRECLGDCTPPICLECSQLGDRTCTICDGLKPPGSLKFCALCGRQVCHDCRVLAIDLNKEEPRRIVCRYCLRDDEIMKGDQ